MTSNEEITACRKDIEEARRKLADGEIDEPEADDRIGIAQRRIDYLEGRGPWHGKASTPEPEERG